MKILTYKINEIDSCKITVKKNLIKIKLHITSVVVYLFKAMTSSKGKKAGTVVWSRI